MGATGVLDEEARRLAERFCREEITVHHIYRWLAERDLERRQQLLRLAEQERRHYMFWSSILGHGCKPSRASLGWITLVYRILGPSFMIRLLERGEKSTIEHYRRFANRLRGEAREILEQIIREEEEHEKTLLSGIEDLRVKYMGYIALGLADAIVEITGVHAGFLGATASTLMAGIAGLVVGFSAALSMAGAAYLQAKHGGEERPSASALVTGLSYIFSVVLLALPYFLTASMALAFAASLAMAMLLSGGFTYYSAVVEDKPFLREFVESAGLLLATALGSYAFGDALGRLAGVHVSG